MGSSCAKDLNYLIAFKEGFLRGLGVEGCSSWTFFSLDGSKETGQCFRNLNPWLHCNSLSSTWLFSCLHPPQVHSLIRHHILLGGAIGLQGLLWFSSHISAGEAIPSFLLLIFCLPRWLWKLTVEENWKYPRGIQN